SGTVPKKRKPIKKRLVVCSAVRTLTVDRPVIVGERLNPTGKKAYREALSRGDYGYVSAQAIEQEDAGADILDINAGVPGEDETELMLRAISAVGAVTVLPLQIDSSDARCVDAALRRYAGKAIVNSVNGDDEVLDRILPVVKKYGAAVIGLTLDKRGIPQNASARVKIAEKIIAAASRYGIGRENVIIDALTLTAAAEQAQAAQTLDALGRIKRLGVKTALGVSNISFGMPGREHVNAAFLTLALERGLDLAIMNPNIESARAAFRAYCVLKNIDKKAEKYISDYSVSASSVPPEGVGTPDIAYCIRKGLKSTGFAVRKALESKTPLEVIDGELIPALDAVGRDFESGKLYLPQLIASAESAKIGFDELKKAFPKETGGNAKGTVMLATVKGDIHDIGKNIVKTVLENYGFDVIDLGRNVDIKDVVDAVCRHNIKLLGLSALMTTTVANMKDTITAVRQAAPDCVIMVGGAVLTADYARAIGADFYGKDAVSSARFAGTVFAKA
ncbi:MAG: dihydropteroate synthase, partial [Clostridiales bacterium]|nr:dihydropteroate synthase [Clostridiales bacterium]